MHIISLFGLVIVLTIIGTVVLMQWYNPNS